MIGALSRMHSWEQTEMERIQRYQELQLQFRGEKNGVEIGYDQGVHTRPYQYRCMGAYVTALVETPNPVKPNEMPRCAVVFPGRYLTHDGRVSTRISQFSFLTLGLCPNCTEHYRIKDVDVLETFQWAREILETRKREQNWTEPKVRPVISGVNEIHLSEKLERELLAHKKRKAKTVDNLIAKLRGDIAACETRVENPGKSGDPHSIVSSAYDKIMSQTSELCSDDMSDDQQTTILALRVQIRNMRLVQDAHLKRMAGGGHGSPKRRSHYDSPKRRYASPKRRSHNASPRCSHYAS
jgi:hypothetical protein